MFRKNLRSESGSGSLSRNDTSRWEDIQPAQNRHSKPDPKGSIFRSALNTGYYLIFTGLISQRAQLTPTDLPLLITCFGLGMIALAFGSVAIIRYKGLQIAGVAAIAIALFLAVTHLRRDDAATVETDAPLVLIA